MFRAAVLLTALVAGAANEVTPLQKVISMMGDMVAKCKSEKHEEEMSFNKKAALCTSVNHEKTKSIAEGATMIEKLEADIAKAGSDAEVLAREIEELQGQIDGWQADYNEQKDARRKQKEDYEAEHHDLSVSVAEVTKALDIVKSGMAGLAAMSSASALLQIQGSNQLTSRARAAIASAIAIEQDEAQPKAATYHSHGSGIQEILENEKAKYADMKSALEQEEIANQGNFEASTQGLVQNIQRAEGVASQKTATKAQRLEDEAAAKSDLEHTRVTKADDEKILTDSKADCAAASEEYEQNQVTRKAEIGALTKATEILSGGDVSGNAEKYLPSALVQASSLVQIASTNQPLRQKIVEFLQGRAQSSGSRFLALAAQRAEADPFAKIKKMVKDMIVKLMEQANEEADKNAYCTTEMSTNKLTRDNKGSEVEELTAQIDELTAQSSTLGTEIANLSDEIAEVQAQMAKATGIRTDEKAENTKVIEDAKVAQVAVEKATQVLEGFYGKQAAMLQSSSDLKQAMTAPYKGMGAESGGVFGMLEVILSDFARLETETSTAESQAQSQYDTFMSENTESKEIKEVEVEHKKSKKAETDERNRNLQKELSGTQDELDAANKYFEKLKADCVDTGMSYEARVQAREEEIQSLKEALEILAQQDLA